MRIFQGYFSQEQLHVSHRMQEIVQCKGIKQKMVDGHLVPDLF